MADESLNNLYQLKKKYSLHTKDPLTSKQVEIKNVAQDTKSNWALVTDKSLEMKLEKSILCLLYYPKLNIEKWCCD